MAKTRTNRIAEWRRIKGWSQQKLADALGVHWTTVSKMERGVTRLDTITTARIAELFEIEEASLLPRSKLFRRLALSGYVHIDGTIEGKAENEPPDYVDLKSDFYDDPDNFFVEVKKNALYPYFREGDVLALSWVYDDERRNKDSEIDYSEFHGRFCLVETTQGDQFIGIIGPGSKPDLINVHNANVPPVTNLAPHALAQVTTAYMAKPARALDGHDKEDSEIG